MDFEALQRGDEQRDIAAAARRLPVIKLPLRHNLILRAPNVPAIENRRLRFVFPAPGAGQGEPRPSEWTRIGGMNLAHLSVGPGPRKRGTPNGRVRKKGAGTSSRAARSASPLKNHLPAIQSGSIPMAVPSNSNTQPSQCYFMKVVKKNLMISVCGLFVLTVAAQEIKPLFADDPKGLKLPPALPRMVDTNGNVVWIDERYTTTAYYDQASQYILREMNDAANELQLPDEALPLSATNANYGAAGYGRNLKFGFLGSGLTKNYTYHFGRAKFSGVDFLNTEQFGFAVRNSPLPIKQLDTAAPYQLATQWLAAASMDVAGLNRDCKAQVALDPWVNGLARLGDKPGKNFVPVYCIWWTPRDHHEVEAAHVELYLPTKKLLQFEVDDPKYNLRQLLVITNMAAVFPGKGDITTLPPPKIINGESPY